MKALFALGALAVVLLVGLVAFDPSYQKMRDDQAWYEAQQQQLDIANRRLQLEERQQQSGSVVATSVALNYLLLAAAAAAVAVSVHAYYVRRSPLVRPDARGLLPVGRDELLLSSALAGELARLNQQVAALRAVHQVPVPSHLTYSPRIASSVAPGAAGALTAPSVGAAPELPVAPSWASLVTSGFAPASDRLLLGYAAAGPLYGSVSDLLSTAIAGRPGQGKSTLLRFVYVQVAALGGSSVVWDLHGSIAGDVPGAQVCETVEQIERSSSTLLLELDERIKGRVSSPARLILVDEWPALALASRSAGKSVARLVLEGRKVGMYVLIAGQGLPADRFGGSLVRDALSSRYVFRTSANQARMAGLERDAADLVLDLTPGRAVLAGPVEPQIVAIPETTVRDVEVITRASSVQDAIPAEPVELNNSAYESPELTIQLIQRLREKGHGKNAIIELVCGVRPGGSRAYRQASNRYDELLGGV